METLDIEVTCKNCGSSAVVKFGIYKGVQRYFCKHCHRKFKDDATVFHMKVPADKVAYAINMYCSGMSVNVIRSQFELEQIEPPSSATIYEWVNKFTDKALRETKDFKPKVGDKFICDETV